MAPAASSCTTSAFPPSTRTTALRRPTVVSGSYVTLSSSTRRTAPPAEVGRLSEPHAPSVSPGTRIRHHISVQVAGDRRVPAWAWGRRNDGAAVPGGGPAHGPGGAVRLVPGGAARAGAAGRSGARTPGYRARRDAGLAGRAVVLH